ncbi:MAG: type III-B CRISPR module RAMP protein Cmr4 [Chitinophagales bacterium]
MGKQCYTVKCCTNLHVGSGSSTMGIIDQMIQRDVVTEQPAIYASSLKGAFREYFEEGPKSGTIAGYAEKIFGKKTANGSQDSMKGGYVFTEACLIGLPVGSSHDYYYIATSYFALSFWLNQMELLGLHAEGLRQETGKLKALAADDKPKVLGRSVQGLTIGDFQQVDFCKQEFPLLAQLLGPRIVVFSDNDFKYQCSDYALPVIARNKLENGESKNLWYEQIIPHQSIFSFATFSGNQISAQDNFLAAVDGEVVQIGANASVGYGLCLINKMELL